MSERAGLYARIWTEAVSIPTYGTGGPNPHPMFLHKRVYQGSSGAVYPHPVIDKICKERADRTYEAVFLENRWLKIMALPELGGRVQMALDKTNGYHFVYYNRVIKPALVGLAGPWISGGIEFNWPQHHRPNTFGPVDWRVVENEDGSRTLWCSEIDRMCRTKGMHGLTIYPDRAYLEVKVQLYNRTPEPQTFLWWANPAVHVNDEYRSVFPQDVHAVMDHGKRDVSSFPIATGTYYKVDYAPGTDISLYRNIPVPTSFMAYHSNYDFLGCYDHGRKAGMLHVADHHISPGKKQWTWGHGDFGRAWDRQLTDEDGPYIELMCGCYTENQPDFSWLMPYEQKSFTQYFMPYKEIGPVKNACAEAALSLDVAGATVRMGVYVTSPRRGLRLRLQRGADVLLEAAIEEITPDAAVIEETTLPWEVPAHELTLELVDLAGKGILDFTPTKEHPADIPDPATPAPPPEEVPSTEQLFLTGLHLEQYRHATYDPQPYYEEALRRDPGDVRSNNALGLLLYRRGRFPDAERCFRRAIRTLTQRNPNPYDGEPYFNLGLVLKMQGRFQDAFDALYKAAWNAAWQDAAFFELARIACRRGGLAEALELVERSLLRNGLNHKARHLKAAILRRLERLKAAERELERTEELDKLDFGALFERVLLERARERDGQVRRWQEICDTRLRGDVHNYIEIALDYAHAGLWEEAIELLRQCRSPDVMRLYYLAWCTGQAGDDAGAARLLEEAARMEPAASFPSRLECVAVFEAAMEACPADAHAPYHLGNFLFAHRSHERAIELWERARNLEPGFAGVHRNLALAYYNVRGDPTAALSALEKAFELDPGDARVLFELDQLQRKLNHDPRSRLALLEKHGDLVETRDDLTVERISLLNLLGREDEALALLAGHTFHPWEGGEGKTTGQYVWALRLLARGWMARGEYEKAAACLRRAMEYPRNLGEGKLPGAAENPVHYELGCALEALGRNKEAEALFEKASVGLEEPASAAYYNDAPPDTVYYQGLALRKLRREGDATSRFQKLIAYGREHLRDAPRIDYFAVSLPDFLVFDEDLGLRNKVHCLYMMGLGFLGAGPSLEARRCLGAVLELDKAHQGAAFHHPAWNSEAVTGQELQDG